MGHGLSTQYYLRVLQWLPYTVAELTIHLEDIVYLHPSCLLEFGSLNGNYILNFPRCHKTILYQKKHHYPKQVGCISLQRVKEKEEKNVIFFSLFIKVKLLHGKNYIIERTHSHLTKFHTSRSHVNSLRNLQIILA